MRLHHIGVSMLLLLAGCASVSNLQDFDGDGSLDQDDCEPSLLSDLYAVSTFVAQSIANPRTH